jgi:hypothetical protein
MRHLDFSRPEASVWKILIEKIEGIEPALASQPAPSIEPARRAEGVIVKSILTYLDQRNFEMASFERLRQVIDPTLSDMKFNEIIAYNPSVFRHAVLKDGKRGLAKVVR